MEYRTEAELTRAQHVMLVASTEFFLPHVKGRLIYSREALKGRASAEPVKHTIPLTFECALLFAAWHASSGRTRLGAAVLIQHATGMRPSELLALKPEHIHLPLARTSAITVRLGATYSTKVKREQYILVDPIMQSTAYSLLARLCITTPTHQRLFPFGYNVYNMSFKQAEGHYGLSLGTTAHSGRAGFATHSVMQGVPRKEIQAQGRWLSESSFNTYIDVAGASHIAAQVNTKQLASTAKWVESHIWKYFDLPNPSDVKSQPQCISGSVGTEASSPLARDLIPEPPQGLSRHQRSVWRQTKWDELHGTQVRLNVQSVRGTDPQPKAKAAAVFGGGGTRSTRSSIRGWCCRRIGKWFYGSSFAFVAVTVAACCGGVEGPLVQVARILGIVADLGEATSFAAGQAVNVTGAIAHAATDVITSATPNGLNTAENIWRGVDVRNLNIRRCAGIMTVEGEEFLREWLNTSAATTLVPCLNQGLVDQMLAAIGSISLSMTSIQAATEDLQLLTSFNHTKVLAQLLPNGRTQVHYDMVLMSYEACWANPLWSQWDVPLSSEQDQILKLLRRAMLDVPTSHPSPQLQQLELEVKFAWPVLRSRARVVLRSALWQASMFFRNFSADTLQGMGAVNFGDAGTYMSFLCVVLLGLLRLSFICYVEMTTPGLMHENIQQWLGIAQPALALTDGELTAPTEAALSAIEEKESSSDGSFSKVSAIRVSDESSSSEHSYLFPEESAPPVEIS